MTNPRPELNNAQKANSTKWRTGNFGGTKPRCACGTCAGCLANQRKRASKQRVRARLRGSAVVEISDEELELRLVAKFAREGWDLSA